MNLAARRIKAVLFDLDATLLDREHSLINFVEKQYVRFYNVLGCVPKERYVTRFVELDANGRVWKDKVYQQLFSEFSITDTAWSLLFEDYVSQFHKHCVGFPNLQAILHALCVQGRLLGIVTNGRTTFQLQNIEALGIADYFSTILVSETEQIRKPDPKIFQRALNHLEVVAQEAIFVGDDPEADIAGAQRVGMQAIWKRNQYWKHCTWADAICDDLGQLPAMIQQLEMILR
jgi:putative hydrolase of the HAD superfamily